jgi:hypothetical protein
MHVEEFYSIRASMEKIRKGICTHAFIHAALGVVNPKKNTPQTKGNENSNLGIKIQFLSEIQRAKAISLGSMPPDLKLMGIPLLLLLPKLRLLSKRWINRG